jgi:hypothetical protein
MKLRLTVLCALGLFAGCGSDGDKGSGGTGGASGSAGSDAGQGGGGGSADAGVTPDGSAAGTGGAGGSAGGSGGAGGASDDGGAPDGGSSAMMTSAMVTASGGGTLSAGGATLVVPGGVLAADKTLTLTVRAPAADEPGRASILGDVYEFGPDGTTFPVPVALTLPLNTSVGADKKVVVAWLDVSSGQWFPVPTTVTADKVTGLVSHFTRFAALELAAAADCPYSGACGGSLEGTWKYAQTCVKPMTSDAFDCGSAGKIQLRQDFNIGGTISITGGRFTLDQQIQATGTLFYPPSCLAIIRESQPTTDCATLQEAWRKQNTNPNNPANWVCAGTVTQGCSCVVTSSASQKAAGSVTVADTKATFNIDGKPPGSPDEFCVNGTTLSVHDSSGAVYTAVKQ